MLSGSRRAGATSANGPVDVTKSPTGSDPNESLLLALRSLLSEPVVPQQPQKKFALIKCGAEPLRQICWYDPSPAEALDQMIRAACAVQPGQDYFLCDDSCTPIAFASSLPTGQTFELVHRRLPYLP